MAVIIKNTNPQPKGQQLWDTPGVYTFTVPVGVTSLSGVLVGAGGGAGGSGNNVGGAGGGGGCLAWFRGLTVTPGETFEIKVGAGGAGGAAGGGDGSHGQWGYLKRNSTGVKMIVTRSGRGGVGDADQPGGVSLSATINTPDDFEAYDRYLGGQGGASDGGACGGAGGGAGGYSGNGGKGGTSNSNVGQTGGTGGAAGGGESDSYGAGGGGGTGVYGEGASGAATGNLDGSEGAGGYGGSGGEKGENGDNMGGKGGWPGGGGGAPEDDDLLPGGAGADGACRLIWGANRYFPDTNTSDVEESDDIFANLTPKSKDGTSYRDLAAVYRGETLIWPEVKKPVLAEGNTYIDGAFAIDVDNPNDFQCGVYYGLTTEKARTYKASVSALSEYGLDVTGLNNAWPYTIKVSLRKDNAWSTPALINVITYGDRIPSNLELIRYWFDETSITIRVKNKDVLPVYVYYEEDDSTPNDNAGLVQPGETVDCTMSGLVNGQTYDIYARARGESFWGSDYSADTLHVVVTTGTPTEEPTIVYSSKTHDSINVLITNEDSRSVTMYADENENPTTSVGTFSAGETKVVTIPGLSPETTYKIYAKAVYNSIESTVAETIDITTNTAPRIPTEPMVNYVSKGINWISVSVINKDIESITICADVDTDYPTTIKESGVGYNSVKTIVISGLDDYTLYDVAVRVKTSENAYSTTVYINDVRTLSRIPSSPTITYLSKTNNTIEVSVTNNDSESVTLYSDELATPVTNRGVLSSVPPGDTVVFDVENLEPSATYRIRARVKLNDVYSSTVETSEITTYRVPAIPEIISGSVTVTANTITLIVKNNDLETCYICVDHDDPTPGTSYGEVASGQTKSITILVPNSNTFYDVYACARLNGVHGLSDSVVNIKTLERVPEMPAFNGYTATSDSITLNVHNMDDETVELYCSLVSDAGDTTNLYLQPNGDASGGDYLNYTIDGLNPNTSYTVYIKVKLGTMFSPINSTNMITDPRVPVSPTISLSSVDTTSITVKVTNKDQEDVAIYVEENDSTPNDIKYSGVGYNVLKYCTVGGLQPNTYYDIYARVLLDGVYSPSVKLDNVKTDYSVPSNPTITFVSKTENSITVNVKNIDSRTVDVYCGTSSSPGDSGVNLNGGDDADITISGLSAYSYYTIYSKVRYLSKYSGVVDTGAIQTDPRTPNEPTITFDSKTTTTITVLVDNEDLEGVSLYVDTSSNPTVYRGTMISMEDDKSVMLSGLSPNTSYTIYARVKLNGVYSSSDSVNVTTLKVDAATPTIEDVSTVTYKYKVKNNDSETAEIFAEHGDTTPDVSRGNVASGSYTSVVDTGIPSNLGTLNVYAQAKVSGKNDSDVASIVI